MDWGKGILLAIIGFIVIIMTMVVISVRMEGIELVTENYYEAEINYQDQIDKEKSTLTLEREVLQFDAENQSLFLDLPLILLLSFLKYLIFLFIKKKKGFQNMILIL